jgi:DNA-binding response OmpR family regulator
MTSTRVPRVLVVDHEQPLVRLVAEQLCRDGFHVTVCFDGPAALRAAREVAPDAVVLDVGAPGLDGEELCRQLRTFSDCYLVMLTGRAREADEPTGRSAGADDYLTKPFDPAKLVARVRAMLDRAGHPDSGPPRPQSKGNASGAEPLQCGPLSVDLDRRAVHLDGRLVELTPIEFDVLAVLAARPELAFTRRQLIDAVWGPVWDGDERLVDVHVGHLRRKLGDGRREKRFVQTVRGVGYRLGSGS